MGKLIYFDYCAVLIIAILLISTIYRKLTKGRVNSVYFTVLVIGMLAVVADIFAVWYDRMAYGTGGLDTAQYIFHSIYLLFHGMTAPIYTIYLLVLSDTDHKMKSVRKIIFSLPFVVALVAIASNTVTHKIFYIDSMGDYVRGPLFWVLYINAICYSLFGIKHVVKYRKVYGKDRFFALFMVFPFMVAAMVAQYLYPRVLSEMIAKALGLLLLSTIVQRPENYFDTDTGFGKKSAYVDDMTRALSNGKNFSVVMVNITNYQAIHDMIGYSNMKRLIKNIAEEIDFLNQREKIKAELYYLGVGKFRFVLDYRKTENEEKAARSIYEKFKKNYKINSMEINLETVMCLTKCPEDIDNVESLMVFGDDINERKHSKKLLYAGDIYQKRRYDIVRNIDAIIERAFAENNFEVYYQPIFSVKENKFNSAEALLRLKDEEYGFISPDLFIPAAEKDGSIHRIGTFVFEEVFKFLVSDEFARLKLDYIEINLSVTQCMRSNLVDEVEDLIHKYEVDPRKINLEITETAASYAQAAMLENIKRLNELGISFSLDDFGTGYSNMSRVATMAFDIVKLDKSFINVDKNPRLQIVLDNTIKMIKEMDMKIVVEGVETEDMAQKFKDLECEYIQGYYYSRPIPKTQFIQFIEENM